MIIAIWEYWEPYDYRRYRIVVVRETFEECRDAALEELEPDKHDYATGKLISEVKNESPSILIDTKTVEPFVNVEWS